MQTLKENFDIDNFVLWVERVQNLKEDVKKNLQWLILLDLFVFTFAFRFIAKLLANLNWNLIGFKLQMKKQQFQACALIKLLI